MDERELLKTELAAQGIAVRDDGTCESFRNGKHLVVSIEDQIGHLHSATRKNKELVREIWTEMVEFVSARPSNPQPGGETTQKMFINAVRMLNRASRHFRSLSSGKTPLRAILQDDVADFGEAFMSKVIELSMGFSWVHHLIRQDLYRIDLLRRFTGETKTAANAGGFHGTFPLQMRERIWRYDEDQEDEENDSSGNTVGTPHMREDLKQTDPVYQFWARRHKLPDTYNDPYKFEEGFVWKELRNDPYEFDDEDENPYPHRNLLWTS